MTKEQLLRKVYALSRHAEKYFDNTPSNDDGKVAAVNNQFVDDHLEIEELLLEEVFAEWWPSISWYLTEPSEKAVITSDAQHVTINNIDEFINYLKNVQGFPDD